MFRVVLLRVINQGVWSQLGPVHTNPFSNENGAVLLRIGLSSTLQRQKRSPKTESFENALQSGAIWKRCSLKTLFSSVDDENDAFWKRWRHPNRHDRAPALSTVRIQNGEQTVPCGFSLEDRCSVDGWKRCENDKCGRKSFWKRSKTAPFPFENGLVWTGLRVLVTKRHYFSRQSDYEGSLEERVKAALSFVWNGA